MPLESAATVAALAAFLWSLHFLIPRAVRRADPLALACALVFSALALGLWLLVGIAVRAATLLRPT